MRMGATRELCELITKVRFGDLPREAVAAASQAILDGVAVGIAGTTETAPRLAAEHVKSLGGREVASVLGFGFRTSPVSAAYVNGISTHVLDFEAMWSPPTHTTSPTLPVVLALAEAEGLPGREIIAGFLKGCEIQGRLRLASKQYAPERLTFHPPGVVGVLGAAVAASHMLDMDAMQLRHAIGIAASRAASLIGNIGSMTKSSHCGLAASLGLDAALLARRGFTANPDILEAPKGYVAAFFGPDFDYEALLQYGRPYRLVDPGLAFKLFPAQYATHFGMTAALDVRRRIPEGAEIRSVLIKTPVMKYVDKPAPRTGLEGKFSFQYTAAAALLDGAVTIGTFTDSRRFRPDMEAFLPKVRVEQRPEIPGELEKMHVEVIVELANGEHVRARCDGPRGVWGTPRITREEHLVKLRDCFSTRFDSRAAEQCIETLSSLEALDARQVRELMAVLARPSRA
jgi:aconitate decarboxylase